MRVVHVLPMAINRGAQVYAGLLAAELAEVGHEHIIATLFADTERGAVRIDRPGPNRGGRLRAAWVDPRAVRHLRRVVREVDPDVLVCHGLEPLKYAVLLARARRPALLCLAIGTAHPQAARGLRRGLYRAVLRRADVVAGVSNDVCAQLRATFDRPDAVLLRNGRNPQAYPQRTRSGSGRAVVVFVGRLVAGKRPDVFIDLACRLRAEGLDVDARMIGTGPMFAALERTGRQAGVAVLGARSDIAALLGEADVFVFTSLPDGEGLPGVLIEAAMAGLPIVTTDVPGARDVVVAGSTGYVVAPSDIEGLARALAALIRDPAERRAMGARARAHAVGEFNLTESLAAWQRELTRAVKERERRRPPRRPAAVSAR